MFHLLYTIKEIPDLSLNKYDSLGDSGVEGVLKRHASFLRQWQGLSELYKLQFQLIYHYFPGNESGNKLELFFAIYFDRAELEEVILRVMKVSPLSDFFCYELMGEKEKQVVESLYYPSCYIVKKIERKKISEDDRGLSLFIVDSFENNKDARLIDMFKMMSSLNEDITYTVLFEGVDGYKLAFDALNKPISILRKHVFGSEEIELIPKRNFVRDAVIENTLKCYENFLNTTINSPCFFVNIMAYSQTDEAANIILNSVCGESLEKGNCKTIKIEGNTNKVIHKMERYFEVVPEKLSFWPTLLSLEEILPFFRLPVLYDGEIIEIRKETAPKFKKNGIRIGKTTDNRNVFIQNESLMKHAFISGVPGSGKTNTMLMLADGLWHTEEQKFGQNTYRNIPFMVLEPAKKEYRELANFDIPDLLIFSPNSNTKFPLYINPFEFPKGLTVSEHITLLGQVFQGAFPMQPPAPFILDRAIEQIYIAHGWKTDDINVGDKTYPTLSDLYDEFSQQLEKTSYDGEIRGNIQSVLEMRIGSLLRREKKDIFDVPKSILTPEEWLQYPTIIELENLGKDTSNFTVLLLCTLIRETLKVNPMQGVESITDNQGIVRNWRPLRHVIFIEEAHNLIASQNEMESYQDSNPKVAATECIVDMLKEVRALREGLIIADQLPTAMAMDIIKNTNIKIVHRLTSADDRGLIASTMSATNLQVEKIATFMPGRTLVSYEGLLRPFEVQIRNIETHGLETPDDTELNTIMSKKPGMIKLRTRVEYQKIEKIKDRIITFLKLEHIYRQALRDYDYDARTNIQIEAFFEDCAKKYQGIMAVKGSSELQLKSINTDYIKPEIITKIHNLIDHMGKQYKDEVTFLINKYM